MKKMKQVAVIMAGGSGTRLWPLSNKQTPKQFLKLTDNNKTMIQLTTERIKKLIDEEDIFIVTTKEYASIVYEQLPNIPKENIVVQPLNRNTAPCIAYVSKLIEKKYGEANVVVLASDHNIKNNKLLLDCIQTGFSNLTNDNIITIGIVPNRIETGYGYIKLGNKTEDSKVYEVEKFVEKPDFPTAKKYYDSGDYLWNSGMFIWNNKFILNCIEKFTPNIIKGINIIVDNIDKDDFDTILYEEYKKMESISIDYAVMEKVNNILVIPGNFGWDDVGGWLALERLSNLDENNNVIKGKITTLNSNDNIIINENNKSLIAINGVDNCIIVQTDNNILILNKDNVNDISKLLDEIKANNYEEHL